VAVSEVGEPTVRPATGADAAAVRALAGELAITFRSTRRGFDAGYRQLLGAADVDLLVVEVDGAVRGYLLGLSYPSLVADGPVSRVEEVAVAAGHRRLGLGARLMAEFERRARERGSRFVALATTRAHAFYLAIGYDDHATHFRKLL
jgi:ribosomal protein S18 acetylase RimI-like enzyme